MTDPDATLPGGPGTGALRRRRQQRLLAGAIGLVVLGVTGTVVLTRVPRSSLEAQQPAGADAATVEVTRMDLVEYIRVDATVGFGPASPVLGRKPGTVTWLPEPGTVVRRGEPLYAVDAQPVPLLVGDTPGYRDLGPDVAPGPDVLTLNQNLAALGYSVPADSDRYGWQTRVAVEQWQRTLKLPVTGRLALGDVVVLPHEVRVDAVSAWPGMAATGELLQVTGTQRLVSAQVGESQRSFADVGAAATILLSDGTRTTGTIQSVTGANPDGERQPTLSVTIAFDDPALADSAETGPVTVQLAGQTRAGVLAVPVQALLALREGGYAVALADEADDGTPRLIPVELGLFADGMVEISGPEVFEGMRVVSAS